MRPEMKLWLGRTAIGVGLVALGVLLSYAYFIHWVKQYPHGDDPKNIDYVLWKHGLNQNMNLGDAVSAMTHDVWSVRLVEGQTKDQLKNRFGIIRELKEARPYDQLCSTNGSVGERGIAAAGKEVVFFETATGWCYSIRERPWI